MAGVSRICNLIAGSLRPFLESGPFPLTKESEKHLLISLSRVEKQMKQWVNEPDWEVMMFPLEKIADSHFHGTCSTHVEQQFEGENICFMDITSVMITFLGLESGFVRHMVGKIFLDLSNLLVRFRRRWYKFMHLLWISLELATSSISCSFPSLPTGSIHVPDESWMHFSSKAQFPGIEDSVFDISTFIFLWQSKIVTINLHTVTGLFHTFRNILKSIKHEDNDLKRAYVYLAMTSLKKMPWSWLNEIHVSHQNMGKNVILDMKNSSQRSMDMLEGTIIQLLCSLVEEKDCIVSEDDSSKGHRIYTEFTEVIHKLLSGFFKHLGCSMSLSQYLKHKLLMLMIRLRFYVQYDDYHVVLWLKLLKCNLEDLLYMPISIGDVGSTRCMDESPFLALPDGDKIQNLCTQHLQRQIIFLFLHCCFRLVLYNNETGEQVLCGGLHSMATTRLQVSSEYSTSIGSVELFEWLKRCASLEYNVDYDSFRRSCYIFTSSFLQFYMEEDDMLFDILLELLDAPVIHLQVSNPKETSFKESEKDITFIISSIFNPIYLFHMFLFLLHYDHSVLVDYLISKDTGIRFLQYLLRCLRIVCTSWHIFLGFSICESEEIQRCYKRKKLSTDEKVENSPLSSSMPQGHKARKLSAVRDVDKCSESLALENAKGCLLKLKKTVEDLHQKDLFPYNPKPLLRSLTRFEELCNR